MTNVCEYCKKEYTSKGNLIKHQRTAKYCLEIQEKKLGKDSDKIETRTFNCDFCTKKFSQKSHLFRHTPLCINKYKFEIQELKTMICEKDKEIDELKLKSDEFRDEIKNIAYETEIRILRESNINDELQNKLHDIAIKAIEQKNEVITNMVKKYAKKQPRKQYDCSNVIYILTTPSLQKERRYILGKSKNLTNRLSTYNKTDEHEVIFYQDCEDEDTMNLLEPTVFKKINEYREQANRERFILPEDKNIDFFIDTIKRCFEFLK